MRKLLFILGASALFFLSIQVFADKPSNQPGNDQHMDQQKDKGPEMRHDDGGPGPQGMMGEEGMMLRNLKMLADNRKVAEELKLTADQLGKIKSMTTDFEKYTIKQVADRALVMIDLKSEMQNDKIDTAKVQDLADKISKNRGDFFKQAVLLRAQILNLLTKDQRQQFEEMQEQHKAMMMKKFKKWKE